MTFDNGPQQGGPGQVPPGQVPLPPPAKKPTRNKANGWLYVGLGALFVLLGVLGFVGETRGAVMNWIFIALGVANGVMGVSAIIKSKQVIDPFGADARRKP